MEAIVNYEVSKVEKEDACLLYSVLNAIHHKDEQVADDELRDDEQEVRGELSERENVSSISSPKTCLISVIEAHTLDKHHHPTDHEGIKTPPA